MLVSVVGLSPPTRGNRADSKKPPDLILGLPRPRGGQGATAKNGVYPRPRGGTYSPIGVPQPSVYDLAVYPRPRGGTYHSCRKAPRNERSIPAHAGEPLGRAILDDAPYRERE